MRPLREKLCDTRRADSASSRRTPQAGLLRPERAMQRLGCSRRVREERSIHDGHVPAELRCVRNEGGQAGVIPHPSAAPDLGLRGFGGGEPHALLCATASRCMPPLKPEQPPPAPWLPLAARPAFALCPIPVSGTPRLCGHAQGAELLSTHIIQPRHSMPDGHASTLLLAPTPMRERKLPMQ